MNKKNDIEQIKNDIKEKIYLKSIMVYRLVCHSSDLGYQKFLDSHNLKPFTLSREEIRKADKIRVVNSKRTWLYKYAIQELIDEGSLIVDNSYCKAAQNNYAKSYALTLNKLKNVLEFLDIEVKPVRKELEWDISMPFVEDSFDGLMTMDRFYTISELKKAQKDWNAAKEYAEYCKSKRDELEFREVSKEWIERSEEWSGKYSNAVREFEKENKNGTENE